MLGVPKYLYILPQGYVTTLVLVLKDRIALVKHFVFFAIKRSVGWKCPVLRSKLMFENISSTELTDVDKLQSESLSERQIAPYEDNK